MIVNHLRGYVYKLSCETTDQTNEIQALYQSLLSYLITDEIETEMKIVKRNGFMIFLINEKKKNKLEKKKINDAFIFP